MLRIIHKKHGVNDGKFLKPVYEAILEGDLGAATESVQSALAAEVASADLLHKALIPAMDEVGLLLKKVNTLSQRC